jgi:hypothetical protein
VIAEWADRATSITVEFEADEEFEGLSIVVSDSRGPRGCRMSGNDVFATLDALVTIMDYD